ncbi:MAG: MarR family transcriptional regulator [Gemmatimonadota bacterium]
MTENPQTDALRLWVILSRAQSAVAEHARADFNRHGLTSAEFGAMEALFHKGPLLLGEVQRKILLSSGGITYVIDRLEQRGLVERRQCPTDRRASYAALTAEGAQLMEEIFPQHAAHIQRALSGLSPQEQREASALLRKLGHQAAELPLEPEDSEVRTRMPASASQAQ